jgi:hypothetical protein
VGSTMEVFCEKEKMRLERYCEASEQSLEGKLALKKIIRQEIGEKDLGWKKKLKVKERVELIVRRVTWNKFTIYSLIFVPFCCSFLVPRGMRITKLTQVLDLSINIRC